MYHLYDNVPFGVIILKDKCLLINYVNNMIFQLFNVNKDVIGMNICKIEIFRKLIDVFNKCFDNQVDKKLNQINIYLDRYFDFIIQYENNMLKIYIYDVTEYIIRENVIRNDREKFLSVWSELKTKCDILEKIRLKEKKCFYHIKNIIYNMSEGIFVLDSNGKFDFCNKSFFKIINLDLGKVKTYKDFFRYIDEHNIDKNSLSLKKLTNNYKEILIPIKDLVVKIKQNDEIKFIELNCNSIKNTDKKLLNTIIILKDITEIKKSETKIKEQSKFIRDVVNIIDIPIAVMDYPSLQYKLLNKEYKNISKLFESDKFNTNCIHIETILKSIVLKIKENGEYILCPYYCKDENGNDKYFKIKFKGYLNDKNEIDRIFLYGLDITDEIKRNKELEKISKMKDEFFSMISHELRTPLTIIYSAIQLANSIYKSEITPNVETILFRINQNSRRLLKLINNILDISKAEAGFLKLNYSSFNLVDVTENIISSTKYYAENKGISLIFDTTEEEEYVSLDKDKYEKILLNLLSNAIKFTPKGKEIMIFTNIEKNFVEISVKDQGVGIPKNSLSNIFDKFIQIENSMSKASVGTGLGLSLVKKLVLLMKGNIEVKSELNKGTEFIIKFNKKVLKENLNEENFELDNTINNKLMIEFSDFK